MLMADWVNMVTKAEAQLPPATEGTRSAPALWAVNCENLLGLSLAWNPVVRFAVQICDYSNYDAVLGQPIDDPVWEPAYKTPAVLWLRAG